MRQNEQQSSTAMAYRYRCLAALPAEISAFNTYMRQNGHYRNLKHTFEDMLPCYCDATKVNSGTIRSRVSQPAFVAKGAD